MTSSSAPPLATCEAEIVSLDEVLRRQIHPDHIRQSEITMAVFKVGNEMVSTYRESVVTPDEAHRIHTEKFGLKTIGSCAVSVGDVKDADLRAIDDSACPNRHESHAYIDMRGLGRKAKDKAAKKLKRAALQNPIWYPPT